MNNTSIWSSTDELCVWWTILVYANMNLPMCNQVAYNWTLLLFFIFPFALNCVSCFPSLSITQTLALFWWARPNWPPGCKLVEPRTRKQQFLVRKKTLGWCQKYQCSSCLQSNCLLHWTVFRVFPHRTFTQTLALFWWARWDQIDLQGASLLNLVRESSNFLLGGPQCASQEKNYLWMMSEIPVLKLPSKACCTELFSVFPHWALLKPLLCSGEQDGTKLTSRVQACWTSYEKAAISC